MERARGRGGPRRPEALETTGLARLRARCVARAEAARARGLVAARAALVARRASAEALVREELEGMMMEVDAAAGVGQDGGFAGFSSSFSSSSSFSCATPAMTLDPGDLEALVDELLRAEAPSKDEAWVDDLEELAEAADALSSAKAMPPGDPPGPRPPARDVSTCFIGK